MDGHLHYTKTISYNEKYPDSNRLYDEAIKAD